MPTWKKIIVSGSNITQLNNDAGYITNATLPRSNAFSTASFSGTNLLADSPSGSLNFASSSGQGLTISANATNDTLTFGLSQIPNASLANSTISGVALGGTLAALTAGSGLEAAGTYTGAVARTFNVDTGSVHFSGGVRKLISIADTTGAGGINLEYNQATGVISGSLVNSSVTLGSTAVNLGSTVTSLAGLTLTGVSATGSFTGSFIGDGSGLTGIATILRVTGSAGNGTVNLLNQSLSILGTSNEIETSMTNQTLTIGLPDDVTIGRDLIVSRNLTVLGTASFQNTTNLEVADRFILLASGSNTAGDGGIVVQQATNNIGELFGFDSATLRWGVTGSFTGNQTGYTPDAFMAAVIKGAGNDPTVVNAKYTKKGNMFIAANEDIWIYS